MSDSIPKDFGDFTVYVGFDSSNFGQMMAYEQCRASIVRHASRPVEVRQLIQRNLEARGEYYREDRTGSTEFTYTRFLVPYLNGYKGWALFVDSDFLFTEDIWKVFSEIRESCEFTNGSRGDRAGGRGADGRYRAVYCVKHAVKSTGGLKMNGLVQSNYPRKNWSSFMLFNCDMCRNLDLNAVNTKSPAWLHRMCWVGVNRNDIMFWGEPIQEEELEKNEERIGELSHRWNYLVGYYHDGDYSENLPYAIHYTEGGPWHPGYEGCEYGDLWMATLTLEESRRIVREREELRKEMEARVGVEELDRERDMSHCQV